MKCCGGLLFFQKKGKLSATKSLGINLLGRRDFGRDVPSMKTERCVKQMKSVRR
jgi:hypothetical protein